jgi:hypothetical protein
MKKIFLNLFSVLLIPSLFISGMLNFGLSDGPYSFEILKQSHILIMILAFAVLAIFTKKNLVSLLTNIPNIKSETVRRLSNAITMFLIICGASITSSWFIKYPSIINSDPGSYSPAMFMSQLFSESLIFTGLISLILSSITVGIIKIKQK